MITNKTERLSSRELLVLKQLANGLLYKEIGYELNISIDTVKKHCKNIYAKLEVRNRTEASNQIHFLEIKTEMPKTV